jgi:hypothetical protein
MQLSTEEQVLFEAIRQSRTSKTPIPSRGEGWGVDLAGAYRVQAALGSDQPLKGYKLGLLSFVRHDSVEEAARYHVTAPFYMVEYDFVLQPL